MKSKLPSKKTGKKEIIVLGGGGHAKQIIGTLLRLPQYKVIGFLDDNDKLQDIFGVPRLGNLSPVPENLKTKLLALGIGHVGRFSFRKKMIEDYKKNGYSFETIISPTAIIVPYEVQVDEGAYIADAAILEPGVKIGRYSIINNCSCINHYCKIGENTHVAPGVMISGDVTVGNDVMIGTGSAIVQGITVEDECLISMGATVVKNLKKGEKVSVFNAK